MKSEVRASRRIFDKAQEMQKTGLTERHLRRFHRLLSTPMLDFDCGKLCAGARGGVPYCCDNDREGPVLFREEYEWRRKQGPFWQRMPIKTKEDRELVDESMDHYVFAICPGARSCQRRHRAIVCRIFPFEPHVNRSGRVLGLAYRDEKDKECPLVRQPPEIYKPRYVSNAILFWREFLNLVPDEKELYMRQSRNRVLRAKRGSREIPVFVVAGRIRKGDRGQVSTINIQNKTDSRLKGDGPRGYASGKPT
ncbi:hypothetical protein ACFLQR_05295 [Verrucomicrobiota bacterium]